MVRKAAGDGGNGRLHSGLCRRGVLGTEQQEIEKEEEFAPVKAKLEAIVAQEGTIDMILSEAAEGWRLNRMGKAELTILRIATYEIRYDEEVPDKVAINEAVELAKKYGNDASSGFVNGVLAKVVAK